MPSALSSRLAISARASKMRLTYSSKSCWRVACSWAMAAWLRSKMGRSMVTPSRRP